ncbi:uncharacterized protein LOC132256346 isoform X3 [Phlebotomus argentipes]|uniref:uncharacterized protein LOC132256346 isoform X3 n=1 Tax=Phlebotomus argentipes TaxID=94469 RepID=UPI0028935921|nr:uncharacterized protein LOC132256346 isoform X3 [Phlebotomus argentipes]
MRRLQFGFVALLSVLGSILASSIAGHRHIPKENFLITDHLADGEFERRISFNGLIGKQTSVSQTTKSLSLWQLTDGHIFLQFIYSGDDKLIDCEYIRQKHHIQEFISKFNGEVALARSHNFTNHPTNHHQYSLPAVTQHEFREFLDNDAIPSSYRMAFEDMEDFESVNDVTRRSERFGMRNFTFVHLRTLEDVPKDLVALMDMKEVKEQCNVRHAELKKIVGGLDSNDEDVRRNASEHLNRFRTCLKMADSPDANIVGKIFFNIVQSKCFILKPEKYCKQRSWWGECLKKGVRKRAHLRDNRKY